MYVCRGVNFTSLLFIDLYRIYIYFVFIFFTLLLMNWQKRKDFRIYICVLFIFYAYVCMVSRAYIEYLYVLCYAWVKGELLQSLSLIHAYIILWVLSSSKRERLLARSRITLVLMMSNSWNYGTNDLMFIQFQIFNQCLSWYLASIKD